ncbi:hypothetical protein NKJ51_12320 [Mesorhizobium sp. M0134]|uniref:hypothetical protein n=1 Tax=Mesorhizobium sp. M0134 TaxID=2956889 RepID=UPI0033353A58
MNLVDKSLQHVVKRSTKSTLEHPYFSNLMMLAGSTAALQVRQVEKIHELSDVEFKVFSQWGEDGIIEWLVHKNGPMPESFVEFGVEDYREANTRFLLTTRNWVGLIIDGSQENIRIAKSDAISWKHDLTALASFVTAENINSLIESSGLSGDIGILSVDIDGNDYWLWKAITCVNPQIVIVEYNSAFGDIHAVSVPYTPNFVRSQAHYSNLYWGASIEAFRHLADERGYSLLGSNRAGSNAFFVRNDCLPRFADRIVDKQARPHRFREGRTETGQLSMVTGRDRSTVIQNEPVVDVRTGKTAPLSEFGELYSDRWSAMLKGSIVG